MVNLPDLTQDDFYRCIFGDMFTVSGVVKGNTVSCMTPPFVNVPTNEGEGLYNIIVHVVSCRMLFKSDFQSFDTRFIPSFVSFNVAKYRT